MKSKLLGNDMTIPCKIEKNHLICPDCGSEKKRESIRCIPCSFENTREKKRLSRLENFNPANKNIRKCKKCQQEFTAYEKRNQMFCTKECHDIWHKLQGNIKWEKRNIQDQPRRNGEKFAYASVSKKPTEWMKKFNACRG